MNGHFFPAPRDGAKFHFYRAAILIILLALIAQPAFAKDGKPGKGTPETKIYGRTLGQWSAKWWKYVVSMPAEGNPITSETGENCAKGQSGPVFFLMGTTGTSVVREQCVVPKGKALFFPILNAFCAIPEDGATVQDIKDLCSFYIDHATALEASVDGVPLENLWDKRVKSPIYSFKGAVDNPFDTFCGTPGTCYEGHRKSAFSDGYWVMLDPLKPGPHEIFFSGRVVIPEWSLDFTVNIIYHLTVED